jgi:D-alanine--poly(phosphoribitol) ligase subunit 1
MDLEARSNAELAMASSNKLDIQKGHLHLLGASFMQHAERPAFCIGGREHSYAELSAAVDRVRSGIRTLLHGPETVVGVEANDDLLTYAALIALWAEGRAYLPLNPEAPKERNMVITARAGLATVLCSEGGDHFQGLRTVDMRTLPAPIALPPIQDQAADRLAYVLFTSGSTGEPKGVPITHGNIATFLHGFEQLGIPFSSADRCLQMFELTFDLSVMSYLVPLLHGACVYTIPKNEIKYGYIAELLEEQGITVALMVPSIINYLRPYFDEIHAPALHTNLFCGEALPVDVTTEWSHCIPNARILNVYGPTEHTIFCTSYAFDRAGENKAINGVLSIGKAMVGTELIIIDEDQRILPPDSKGELCLGGGQMTPGYWQDAEKTEQVIFMLEHNGRPKRFYRTGDVCTMDAEGDVLYLGRLDHQVKIQGYRVELAEIEHHARHFLKPANAVALAVPNALGNNEVALIIEGAEQDTKVLIIHLREHLPAYMVPTRLRFVEVFPLNVNGKTDRKALQRLFTT